MTIVSNQLQLITGLARPTTISRFAMKTRMAIMAKTGPMARQEEMVLACLGRIGPLGASAANLAISAALPGSVSVEEGQDSRRCRTSTSLATVNRRRSKFVTLRVALERKMANVQVEGRFEIAHRYANRGTAKTCYRRKTFQRRQIAKNRTAATLLALAQPGSSSLLTVTASGSRIVIAQLRITDKITMMS